MGAAKDIFHRDVPKEKDAHVGFSGRVIVNPLKPILKIREIQKLSITKNRICFQRSFNKAIGHSKLSVETFQQILIVPRAFADIPETYRVVLAD